VKINEQGEYDFPYPSPLLPKLINENMIYIINKFNKEKIV